MSGASRAQHESDGDQQAGVSHLLDKAMSAETRKLGEATLAFVKGAAKELGERELVQKAAELA